jgi:hypothetical protein
LLEFARRAASATFGWSLNQMIFRIVTIVNLFEKTRRANPVEYLVKQLIVFLFGRGPAQDN